MLFYLTIFGILIKEISSDEYVLAVDGVDKGATNPNRKTDYQGPLKFYLKTVPAKSLGDNYINVTLTYDNGKGIYNKNCTKFNSTCYFCQVNEAIPGQLKIKIHENSERIGGNTYRIEVNGNDVVNKEGSSISGIVYADSYGVLQNVGNGVHFPIYLQNPLPVQYETEPINVRVNNISNTARCSGSKGEKELSCNIEGARNTDNITITDNTPLLDNDVRLNLNKPSHNVNNYIVPTDIDYTRTYESRCGKLGAAGILSIILSSLAGLAGLAFCLLCNRVPPGIPPIIGESFAPIAIPEIETAVAPIILDDAHPVIPSPMPQVFPTPILPPPKPVIPVVPVVPVVEPVVPVVEPVVPVVEPVVPVVEPVVPVVEPVVEQVVEPVLLQEPAQVVPNTVPIVQDVGIVQPTVTPVVEPVVQPVAQQVVEPVLLQQPAQVVPNTVPIVQDVGIVQPTVVKGVGFQQPFVVDQGEFAQI